MSDLDLDDLDLGRPVAITIGADGTEVPLFTIGSLARALGRTPQTVRAWERDNYLPKPRWRKSGRSKGPRGRRVPTARIRSGPRWNSRGARAWAPAAAAGTSC